MVGRLLNAILFLLSRNFFSLERHFNATHRRCPYFSERTCNYGSITGRPHASVRRIYDVTHCFFSVVSFRLWRRGPRLTHYITLQFTIYITYNFYCAIQCIARYCDCMSSVRLSVRLPACDVGGSGSHSLKILETNCTGNQPNTFALRSPKAVHLIPGEHGEILGRLEVEWEKWRAGATFPFPSTPSSSPSGHIASYPLQYTFLATALHATYPLSKNSGLYATGRNCQSYLGFNLPSDLWPNRVKRFDVKYATSGGSFVN